MTTVLDTLAGAAATEAPAPAASSRPHRDLWTALAVTLPVLVVQAWNITGYPTVSDDEGTYLAQAWSVQHWHGLAPYTYWYDHPPLGWIQIAMLSWLPGLFSSPAHLFTAEMRVVMVPVTAVCCLLLFVLARRLGLARWAAGLGVLLFGLSPLSVGLQRELFLDNFAVLWMLAALVLAASPRRHLWHHISSGLAAGAAVLSKETMLVALPALVLLLWQRSDRTTRKFSLVGFAAAFTLTVAQYPLYALLKNELLPGTGHVSLWGGIAFQLGRAGSGSLLTSGTGSNQTLDSWLYYDHVLIVAGLVAAVAMSASRQLRAPALAVLLFTAVAVRPDAGYLPAMYIIQVLPFLALCIAATAQVLVRTGLHAFPRIGLRPLRWAAVAVAAVLAAGYVVPHWFDGDRTAVTANANAQYDRAVPWIHAEIPDPAGTRIVVDDAMWLDLVHDGFRPGTGVIWFYKVDLDPAVAHGFPKGWRSLDYIVSTPTLRQDPDSLPTVEDALTHSTVIASFGSGTDLIQIRKIDKSS